MALLPSPLRASALALSSSDACDAGLPSSDKGAEVDPSNALMKSGLETARQHAKSTTGTNDARGRDVSSPAGGAGGSGQDPFAGMGGGAGGGMPDLSGLMNNPMIAQMAQQMISNGGLEQLMK
jgi:small glutamine-rich tetratricopeptide repeat-containing protein alpha